MACGGQDVAAVEFSQMKRVWPMSIISISTRTIIATRSSAYANQQWRPRQIFKWRPATAGLPPTGLQNVPVDLQIVSLKLLDMLG